MAKVKSYPSRAHVPPGSVAYYEAVLANPNVQRGLSVIRSTEGTARRADPYSVGFGYAPIKDLSWHPGTSHAFSTKSGKKSRTTAAGAYQFLSKTWNGVASKLGLKDFSKRSQDIAAVALIDARGGLQSLMAGDLRGFINAVGPEWASLPSAPKAYDQPTKSWGDIERAWAFAGLDQNGAPLPPQRFQTVAVRPVAPNVSQGMRLASIPTGGRLTPEPPTMMAAAPIGRVERSPLAPAQQRAPDPARFAYDVTPPAQPGGFSFVSQANAAPMPNNPVTTPKTSRLPAAGSIPAAFGQVAGSIPAALAAPAVSRLSRPVTPTPASALAAMNKPAFPSALVSPTAIGVPQTLAPMQTVQPTFVPAPVPAPPMAPPRTIQSRPVFEAPAPAPEPRNTAMDVYNGLANEGFANDGSKVTRDQFGGTSITNKFGATTTTLANGRQAASFGPSAPGAPSGGISGPLGGTIGNALEKTFEPDPALNGRSPFGNFARQTGGRFAGATVGSFLGPVGSILGGLIGQELAKPHGGKIGDFVNGVRTVNVMGQPMQFARQDNSLNQFPSAPNVSGALGGRQSNRSGESMREISPKAARDISRGRGGLF